MEVVQSTNGAKAARDRERFANLCAELSWGVRIHIFRGDIQLSDDSLLAEELAVTRYVYAASGKIQIEAKEALKRRLGRSPDRADMLAIPFHADWDASDKQPRPFTASRRAAPQRNDGLVNEQSPTGSHQPGTRHA